MLIASDSFVFCLFVYNGLRVEEESLAFYFYDIYIDQRNLVK